MLLNEFHYEKTAAYKPSSGKNDTPSAAEVVNSVK